MADQEKPGHDHGNHGNNGNHGNHGKPDVPPGHVIHPRPSHGPK